MNDNDANPVIFLRRIFPLLVAMAALLGIFQVWVPNFLSAANMIDLAQQISVNAILAFGMTLTILIGGIDLSVGAVIALVGTVTVAILSLGGGEPQTFFQFMVALFSGLGVALLFGGFNGICASKTGIPPFIITLATMQVARGCALRFNEGRPMSVPDSQQLYLSLGNGRLFEFLPVPVVIMLIIFVAMALLLHKTQFGRHLFAIGGNRTAAWLSGIPLLRRETVVYMICAVLAGVAGMIHSAQLYSAEPASGAGFELNAIAAVVVGGTSFTGGIGSMHGTLLGAVIIGILDKGLNQAGVHFSLQYVTKGVVILGAVYLDVLRQRKG